ncbi:hypothetical protein C9374_010025 [Naegleria lovaniensis]|uniref:NHL repeat domain-containing protein n=1 Tax=Naegleria lovaniensis TaxID=51637 RepID=A0AA88KGM1_NAELO|nr:uncharacterized protein C9374_010025 [Naegleria lovaniensis]KAG2375021.1 hypothetical protein C9374_010025 [Naegleria lovaniensis]
MQEMENPSSFSDWIPNQPTETTTPELKTQVADGGVRLILLSSLSDHANHVHLLIQQLSNKLQFFQKRVAFSLNFDLIHSFGQVVGWHQLLESMFTHPFDIKISNNHHCIMVSDAYVKRIHVFDLTTREWKLSIQTTGKPYYLCLEENYDGKRNQDALIFECVTKDEHVIYKYDLQQLLCNKSCEYLWKYFSTVSELGSCMCIQYNKEECEIENLNDNKSSMSDSRKKQKSKLSRRSEKMRNCLLVSDYNANSVKMFNAKTGNFVKNLEFKGKEVKSPYFMLVTRDSNELILTEVDPSNRVKIYKERSKGIWDFVIEFGTQQKLYHPFSLAYDSVSMRIVVSDYERHRIVVYNKNDGSFITQHGSKGQSPQKHFKNPNGICLDERNGELYVCDYKNFRVLVFK